MSTAGSYRLRWAERDDAPAIYKVFQEGAAGLGGPVPTATILGFMTPTRMCVVLESVGRKDIVGASCSRFPTQGVCFHALFATSKAVRGQGLGGAILAGTLRFLATAQVKGGHANPFQAHKWFAAFPEYNTAVEALYHAQGWVTEGCLVAHTKSKTALHIRAYYVDRMALPAFWHDAHPKMPVVTWKDLLQLPRRVQTNLLGEVATPDQGRDGGLW